MRSSLLIATLAFASACSPRSFNSSASLSSTQEPALPALTGRYAGMTALKGGQARKVGLILDPHGGEGNYLAIVIQYTSLLKDDPVENIKQGIDRVVDRISLYKAVPTSAGSTKYALLPMKFADGTLTETASPTSRDVSVLEISRKSEGGSRGGLFNRGNQSPYTAVITAADKGEPVKVEFDTFLEKAKVPTSTWDKDFIPDVWEGSYVFAKAQAKTAKVGDKHLLDIEKPVPYKGKYVMKEARMATPSQPGGEVVQGLFAMTPSDASATNALDKHVGIFIDVVNRKPRFATRELFLIDPTGSAQSHSEQNPQGFVMYFQQD